MLILAKLHRFLKVQPLRKSHFYFLDFLVEFQTVMVHRNILVRAF